MLQRLLRHQQRPWQRHQGQPPCLRHQLAERQPKQLLQVQQRQAQRQEARQLLEQVLQQVQVPEREPALPSCHTQPEQRRRSAKR